MIPGKVIGEVESKLLGRKVPLVEVKWMDEEKDSEQNAIDAYKHMNGEDPKSGKHAVAWMYRYAADLISKRLHKSKTPEWDKWLIAEHIKAAEAIEKEIAEKEKAI